MVERLVSFYDGLFSGAMLVSGGKSFALPPFLFEKKRYNEFSSPKFSLRNISPQRGLEKEWTCTRIPWWIRHRRFGGVHVWELIVSVHKNPWECCVHDFQRGGSWGDSPKCIQMEVRKHPPFFMDYEVVEEMFGFWFVFERWDYYGAYN